MRADLRAAIVVLAAAIPASATAADADGDPSAKLRSLDAAVRLEGVKMVLDAPKAVLDAKRAPLRATLRRLLLDDPSAPVRGASGRALARVAGDAAIEPLLVAVSNERDAVAERRLPEAFQELDSDAARKSLAQLAFDDSDPRRAALAAEALGFLPKAGGLDDLTSLLDSAPHWAIASGACLGLGQILDVGVIPRLLPRLRHPDPAVRCAARESLVRLTGEDFGTDPAKWEAWWVGAKATFRFPDQGPEGPSMRRSGTSDRPMGDGDKTFARFFGVELRRRRVAFVIDFSQSMWGPRRDRAQEELIAAVKGLPSTNTFAVVLFAEHVWWFRQDPLPGRPQEKLDLARYLAKQETKAYTNIYDALESALGLAGIGDAARDPAPGLDEVVLLSDGFPNCGKLTQPARILGSIRAMNAGRVVIDTVALGPEPGDFLPQLAKENGGKFVACPFAK